MLLTLAAPFTQECCVEGHCGTESLSETGQRGDKVTESPTSIFTTTYTPISPSLSTTTFYSLSSSYANSTRGVESLSGGRTGTYSSSTSILGTDSQVATATSISFLSSFMSSQTEAQSETFSSTSRTSTSQAISVHGTASQALSVAKIVATTAVCAFFFALSLSAGWVWISKHRKRRRYESENASTPSTLPLWLDQGTLTFAHSRKSVCKPVQSSPVLV